MVCMRRAGWMAVLAFAALLLQSGCSSPFAWLPSGMPVRGVCAHRGNDGRMPENTVPAWRNAARSGAEMVELDVKRCATGELVIMHDRTVDRTTSGTGEVARLSFPYIRSLNAACRKGRPMPGFEDVKVPTFDEALDAVPREGVWINCHCSPGTTVEVARKIREKGRLHQAFVAASLGEIAAARKEVPGVLACNMSRTYKGVDAYRKPWPPELSTLYARQTIENGCQFLQLLAPCSKADADMLHAAGVKIAYFHCEDPEKVGALLDLGVDFILTDNLEAIREKVKELRK